MQRKVIFTRTAIMGVREQAVFCGEHVGTFVFPEDESAKVNNSNAKIVLPDGDVISPSAFESLAGKGSQKKWKSSIRVSLDDGRVLSIGTLIDERAKTSPEAFVPVQESIANRCSAIAIGRPFANITVFPFVRLTEDGSLRQGSQKMAAGRTRFFSGHTIVRTVYGNDWNSFNSLFRGARGAFIKCFFGLEDTCAMVHVDNLEIDVEHFLLAVKVSLDNPLFPTRFLEKVRVDEHVLDLDKKWSEYMSADAHYSTDDPYVVHVA